MLFSNVYLNARYFFFPLLGVHYGLDSGIKIE
jgi:hypothetical protein